ncbi:membrane or secreted protein [Flavobacteriaceae bacterium F08102]|nr:membrane or secreted protein [Flavobacteriaceae bacterium F08102]
MKNIKLLLLSSLLSIGLNGQSLIGAWERQDTNEQGEKLKSVLLFADGYQVLTTYNATTGKFIQTNGGTWSLEGDMMTKKIEFDSENSNDVGEKSSFKVVITEHSLTIAGTDMVFTRLDDGTPGSLQGAWLMSGRVRDGVRQSRDTSGPRKTMKILSGTRFQWIAYNTQTKQFMGTGGGTYTTDNETYTENIEFFSKDDTRVGAHLSFNYQLKEGDWHHSGLSSKGDPIYEIWSVRN